MGIAVADLINFHVQHMEKPNASSSYGLLLNHYAHHHGGEFG